MFASRLTSCFYCLPCAFDAPFRFVVSTFLLRCSIFRFTSLFSCRRFFFFVFNFEFFDIRFPTFDFDPRFPTFDFDLARRRGEHGERQLHYITYP